MLDGAISFNRGRLNPQLGHVYFGCQLHRPDSAIGPVALYMGSGGARSPLGVEGAIIT